MCVTVCYYGQQLMQHVWMTVFKPSAAYMVFLCHSSHLLQLSRVIYRGPTLACSKLSKGQHNNEAYIRWQFMIIQLLLFSTPYSEASKSLT